jgi:riboflavin kinase/FMN adenylyltransferase
LKIFEDISKFYYKGFSVVTVGTFDGLHIGHQEIISRMKTFAREKNGETILITFDPHPRIVLDPNHDVKFILTRKRKFELLSNLGIDNLIILPFTKEFSRTSSEDFIKEYLIGKLSADMLIVGYDHHFGRNREGNYEQLHRLGKTFHFEVAEIPAQYVDDIPVSSTKIRNALTEGNVRLANKMLGFEYSITGKVIAGNKIGRTIGFPTANIEIEDKYKLIAAGGVYACKVECGGKVYKGMGNIGTRPTIGKHDFTTEVHLFDFDEDIYGKEITIYFIDRVRDEVKFSSLDELKDQLSKDRQTVLSKLNTRACC